MQSKSLTIDQQLTQIETVNQAYGADLETFEDLNMNYLDTHASGYIASEDASGYIAAEDQRTTDLMTDNVIEALQNDFSLELTPRGIHIAADSVLGTGEWSQG